MTWDVTIVTHAGAPRGTTDDCALAAALAAIGATFRFAVWNDRNVNWSASPIAIIRSTWDYHLQPVTWRQWLDRVSWQTRLVNPPDLLRWNTDKRYLLALRESGVSVVPTLAIEHDEIGGLKAEIERHGWSEIVVKPAIAASAFGARRFGQAELREAIDHARTLAATGAVLVQPFEDGVLTDCERSLVMLGGRFSHAFTKPAFDKGAAGGRTSNAHHAPDPTELWLATAALAALAETPTYARIDLVPAAAGPLLMELELIEPHLALADHPPAARALAELLFEPSTR